MSYVLRERHAEALAEIAAEFNQAAGQLHEHASVLSWAGDGLDKVDTNFHWRWVINNARDIAVTLARYDELLAANAKAEEQ